MSTQTEQLHLVNIITLGEDKLQKNFSLILNRLKEHDRVIGLLNTSIEQCRKENHKIHSEHTLESEKKFSQIHQQIDSIQEQLKSHSGTLTYQKEAFDSIDSALKKFDDTLLNQKLYFDELVDIKTNQISELQERDRCQDDEIGRISEEIITKQSIVEVEKVIKKLEEMKQKNHILDSDVKLLSHKMEKVELISQKNQRMQAKHQAEMMKEFEEKVKKQIKMSRAGSHMHDSEDEDMVDQRISFRMEEEEMEKQLKSTFTSTNVEKNYNSMNHKITSLEQQMKDIHETIRGLRDLSKKASSVSSDGFSEKINEQKSEAIKIWGKCDALEDKIVFLQRKLDEKGKIITSILESQRQNSYLKIDDKLKTFQTEMYTYIKDFKSKIESKVNIQEFQKYVHSLESKQKQLNQQIFLKSDKIEVKKALLFLESKIKEIILVISEDEQNEKEALLTKKQLKCISCDKDVERMTAVGGYGKGNWDSMPFREHPPEILGRFGMTNYGSLSKKLKKLEGQDLPVLSRKRYHENTEPNS